MAVRHLKHSNIVCFSPSSLTDVPMPRLKYRLPTDIQAEAIPLILGGGDVLMAAETGSGKTGVSVGVLDMLVK